MYITLKLKNSIKETEDTLKKALSYSEDLQDKELINFCENHLIKLNNMLDERNSL